MKWGSFEQVELPEHKRYVRAYWRFLLGWQDSPQPKPEGEVGRALRNLAREEVYRYREEAKAKGGKVIEGHQSPPNPA
jgi:hypothetical protein